MKLSFLVFIVGLARFGAGDNENEARGVTERTSPRRALLQKGGGGGGGGGGGKWDSSRATTSMTVGGWIVVIIDQRLFPLSNQNMSPHVLCLKTRRTPLSCCAVEAKTSKRRGAPCSTQNSTRVFRTRRGRSQAGMGSARSGSAKGWTCLLRSK